MPAPPATQHLDEIAGLAGNAQLLELCNRRDQLKNEAATWRKNSELISQRQPRWTDLEGLVQHAAGLPVHAEVIPQVDAIRDQRSLLANPDPVPPLCQTLTRTSMPGASAPGTFPTF